MLLLTLLVGACWAEQVAVLDGGDWVAENGNGSIRIGSRVPGNIYLDLQASGRIGDPRFRFNEREDHWIALEPIWSFSKYFHLAENRFSRPYIDLEGIDTIAEIYLNGDLIGKTNNMFRKWQFSARNLHFGKQENHLQIRIQSAVLYAKEMASKTPYSLPSSDWLKYSFPHRNLIRKSQSDFGWDWGPAFAGRGIWKSVRLVEKSQISLSECSVDQHHFPNETVVISISARIHRPPDDFSPIFINAVFGDFNATKATVVEKGGETEMARFQFRISSPKLWWPRGYGDAHLYPLSCRIIGKSGKIAKKIGLRRTELVREEIGSGTTFFFKVNGISIFAKGANVIPLDSFPTAVGRNQMEKLLKNAVLANMNMLRIWGGGIYQPDEFYSIADELGILIWQELMFACATYPRDNDFLENVAQEVEEQIRRLKDHPSIIAIGGNNENEVGMGWYSETRENPALYYVDYAKLYIDVIRERVLSIAPSIEFIVSSPSNGPLSSNPFVLRWGDANSQEHGDMHFYDYDHDCSDPDIFPDSRFISEFGFQSLPSLETLRIISNAEDLFWDSELMNYRQRHENGNAQLLHQISMQFRIANHSTFDQLIFLSQATQCICYRTGLEKWRRGKATFSTMGILYWQLNSIWAAPTWSSLEAKTQKWKMLHYQIKELFAPILVSIVKSNNSTKIHIITDLISDETASLVIRVWNLKSRKLKEFREEIRIQPNSDRIIEKFEFNEEDVIYAAINSSNGEMYSNIFSPRKFKDLDLNRPNFTIEKISMTTLLNAEIEFKSSELAAFVLLETSLPGQFSKNAPFLVLPDTIYKIIFTSESGLDLNQLESTLKFTSLYDTIPAQKFIKSDQNTIQE